MLDWRKLWSRPRSQAVVRLSVIAQVLAVCIAWVFALGGWWHASHSTVLGSAQFCPAELAGWWMPVGYSCCLAQMQRGPVRNGRWAVTVNPSGSREFEGSSLSNLISSLEEESELSSTWFQRHCVESRFRIFDMNLQPSWKMEMNVKEKNIRDLGRVVVGLGEVFSVKIHRRSPGMVSPNMQTKRKWLQRKPSNVFIILIGFTHSFLGNEVLIF